MPATDTRAVNRAWQHALALQTHDQTQGHDTHPESTSRVCWFPRATGEAFDVTRAMHGLQHKLTLSPVVSAPKHFIYCGIPKCGVSRWRRLLRRIEGNPAWRDNKAHSPQNSGLVYLANLSASHAHAFANHPRTLSFVVVRNPFTRLLSGWLDKTQVRGRVGVGVSVWVSMCVCLCLSLCVCVCVADVFALVCT